MPPLISKLILITFATRISELGSNVAVFVVSDSDTVRVHGGLPGKLASVATQLNSSFGRCPDILTVGLCIS